MAKVVIIGAGASGMAAAIAAAQSGEHRVTLIERQARVGRKLLSTGNGRCNLSNMDAELSRYHGANPAFAAYALSLWSSQRVLDFFAELGLMTVTEYGGRVYPLSNQASSVLDVLRFALEKPNIELLCGTSVESVRRKGKGFSLTWEGGGMDCDKLIVACGGCAGSKLGGVMDGYKLLKSLGHSRTSLYPSLTQIRTRPEIPRSMKGVKVQAGVEVFKGKNKISQGSGDLLFADNGVSGTVVFDISRAVATAGEGVSLRVDFFEALSRGAVENYLARRRAARPEAPAKEIFSGALHSRVGLALCKYAEISPESPCAQLSDAQLAALAAASKALRLEVTGVSGFESAQVTAGGISTAEFDPKTMESKLVPNLFACGEVLDVDGDCGGYNLQWAWASGLLAGGSL